jgi:electron transport complex protein RnfA
MTALFLTIISTALINNVVLSQFMGLCPFLGVSKKIKTAAGMGAAVIFVITIASFITSLLYKYVLDTGLNLTYLTTIVFILVIAALVQIVEMIIKKMSPALYQSLGVYLPLITTNCAVLGVALTNVQNKYDVLTGTIAGIGTATGFAIAIIIMAGVRERCENNNVPKAWM